MELEYEGLTNSTRFLNQKNEVEIDRAFESYMPSENLMKANLKYFINMEDKECAKDMLKTQIQYYANMYFTLFDAYKNNKAI